MCPERRVVVAEAADAALTREAAATIVMNAASKVHVAVGTRARTPKAADARDVVHDHVVTGGLHGCGCAVHLPECPQALLLLAWALNATKAVEAARIKFCRRCRPRSTRIATVCRRVDASVGTGARATPHAKRHAHLPVIPVSDLILAIVGHGWPLVLPDFVVGVAAP